MPRQFNEDGPSFELLPEGTYSVQLRDIEDKETSTGRTQWMFTFEVLDHTQENGEPFLLFARTWPNRSGFLDAFDPQRLWAPAMIDDPAFDVDSLCGGYYYAEVKHREYDKNGAKRVVSNVVSIAPLEQSAPATRATVPPPAPFTEPDYGDPFKD